MKEQKYPYKFRIKGNIFYKVVWVDAFDDATQMGECNPKTKTISILLGMSPEDTLETIIHELLHALEMEYCLTLPHKIIAGLEGAIAKFWNYNKDKLK